MTDEPLEQFRTWYDSRDRAALDSESEYVKLRQAFYAGFAARPAEPREPSSDALEPFRSEIPYKFPQHGAPGYDGLRPVGQQQASYPGPIPGPGEQSPGWRGYDKPRPPHPGRFDQLNFNPVEEPLPPGSYQMIPDEPPFRIDRRAIDPLGGEFIEEPPLPEPVEDKLRRSGYLTHGTITGRLPREEKTQAFADLYGKQPQAHDPGILPAPPGPDGELATYPPADPGHEATDG
jgi:hypothetical protein